MSLLTICGCQSETAALKPVTGFALEKYVGTWYEIARFPHSFEEGLTDVQAIYATLKNGRITVVNRGYDPDTESWTEAKGKAKPAGAPEKGHLKVSFFGPFYADYKVLYIDEDYQHAIVGSSSWGYLWLLARKPEVEPKVYDELVKRATAMGYKIEKLIRVSHDRKPENP